MKNEFLRLVEIIDRLRSKNGCPWDRKQNFKSIREPLLEESYEVVDAINKRDYKNLREELGDLLIQVVFLCRLANEKKKFSMKEVIKDASDKLVRRHPHIFGKRKVRGTAEVLKNWEHIKESEKKEKKYILQDIPDVLPALVKAKKIQNKVSRFGFDWKNIKGPVKKLREEVGEFIEAVKSNKKLRIEQELGDVLFSIVNIARYYHIDAESSLNLTIEKFRNRFDFVEDSLKREGKTISDSNLNEMDKYWNESKKHIK